MQNLLLIKKKQKTKKFRPFMCNQYLYLNLLYFYSACNCSSVGSNDPDECDRYSGQCSCKPNVIGRTCDQCRPDYFNFTSGQGCQGKEVKYCACV